MPLLEIKQLSVTYTSRVGAQTRAVVALDLHLERGEVVGILGESGSGKSSLCAAIVRMHPSAKCRISGSVRLEGRELTALPNRDLRAACRPPKGFCCRHYGTLSDRVPHKSFSGFRFVS